MDALKEIIIANPGLWLAVGGLVVGLIFGLIVQNTNFCTMGSISDILSFGSYNRFRAWLLACAVAILGVAGIEALGVAKAKNAAMIVPTYLERYKPRGQFAHYKN